MKKLLIGIICEDEDAEKFLSAPAECKSHYIDVTDMTFEEIKKESSNLLKNLSK